jgi:tRNA U34 5-methylaminomethyl-2-thiouridine-forming methyltransferase MnmC|tara:strand:- start:1023 stop:1694 length:672 start_codon:yes stop_codon:yes gene_type:complete
LKRSIITTSDGSKTIQIEGWNEQYHSIHGALQEAKHVYINAGLKTFLERQPKQNALTVLEIGFGTGLNALLTALESLNISQEICYHGIEAYPVEAEELQALGYHTLIGSDPSIFQNIHNCSWHETHKILPHFSIVKRQAFFSDIAEVNAFDVIYFDAFGPRVQPNLWIESIFKKMYEALRPNGLLVTYCAKGSVRRCMQAVGFEVERLPGPPGKREMLRAIKL